MQAHDEAFLQILAHRSMLKAFILSIVHDPHLAEDTLSDVTLVIVRSWDKYEKQRPFGPWARGVAKRVALVNLRTRRRPVLTLDDDVLEAIGSELSATGDEGRQEELKQRLRRCLDQLSPRKRELIRLRYFEERSYAEIAQRTMRTVSALYMAFSRIHTTLAQCVRGSL